MCVVAVKYIDGFGWVGAKNRDRCYQTSIEIKQSNRKDIQRLYIDDQTSRWTEGVNEFGVCIISASFSVKSDEKEGDKALDARKKKRASGYYSADGKNIRDALLLDTPKKAVDHLIKCQLAGATFIFNQTECYLLEGGFTVKKDSGEPRDYIYKVGEVKRGVGYAARTNHGIWLPQLGYKEDPTDVVLQRSRDSSESRFSIVFNGLNKAKKLTTPVELLDIMSATPHKDVFMNPVRKGDSSKGEMVTTGQLLLVPKERTLHYRPIYSSVSFKYDKLNGPKSKTFFEIISSRKLLSFKEFEKK